MRIGDNVERKVNAIELLAARCVVYDSEQTVLPTAI